MSYANRREMGTNKKTAMIVVLLFHVALAIGLVQAFGFEYIKEKAEKLTTFEVEVPPPPPPPEEPPPPPKDNLPPPPPQVAAPPPLVRTVTPPNQIQTTQQLDPKPQITETATPQPQTKVCPGGETVRAEVACPVVEKKEEPKKVEPARSKGSLVGLFSADDYPSSAQRDNAEGTAVASINVGPDGRVTGCSITRSTGNGALDAATCAIIRRKARFTPARDSSGNPTSDTVTSPPIQWKLEDE